jgi:small-conductance mechanosensitive channel
MFSTWAYGLQSSFQNIWIGFAQFVPNFLAAIIIFLVGWIVAALVGKAVAHLINLLKIDNALRGTEVERALNRGGFRLDIGRFIGGIVKWFIIVVFLVAALNVLGLDQVNVFLQQVLAYIPQIVVAVFILLIAAIVGEALQRIVSGSAAAAHLPSANLIGSITKWAIWIFAILAAMFQLGIAAPFVQTLFTGVIIAFSLAVGLAFGLGGQQAASDYIQKLREEISNRNTRV